MAQDVIVREEDCGTDRGLLVSDIKEGTEMIEPFIERIEGRYSKETIRHPETDEIIIRPDELITPEIAKKITDAGIEQMYIRSAFTCNARHGVCEKCYGKNLATGEKLKLVKQLVQLQPNLSVNQVHSLQCVHSIQVG